MNRLAAAMILVSTLVMFAIIAATITFGVAQIISMPPGEAIFVVVFTAISVVVGSWIGLRLARPLIRRNQEYAERLKRKRES